MRHKKLTEYKSCFLLGFFGLAISGNYQKPEGPNKGQLFLLGKYMIICKRCGTSERTRFNKCKHCVGKDAMKWAKDNRVRFREIHKKSVAKNKEKNKEKRRAYRKDYNRNYTRPNKLALKAEWAVRRATKTGKLEKVTNLNCADCGESAKQYHHEDYNKPLNVVPLCLSCHGIRHRIYK